MPTITVEITQAEHDAFENGEPVTLQKPADKTYTLSIIPSGAARQKYHTNSVKGCSHAHAVRRWFGKADDVLRPCLPALIAVSEHGPLDRRGDYVLTTTNTRYFRVSLSDGQVVIEPGV